MAPVECDKVVKRLTLGGGEDGRIIGVDDLRGLLDSARWWVVHSQRSEVVNEVTETTDEFWELGQEDAVGFNEDLLADDDEDFFRFAEIEEAC